jgi:hypothetical protein
MINIINIGRPFYFDPANTADTAGVGGSLHKPTAPFGSIHRF